MCGGDQVDDTEEGKPDFGKRIRAMLHVKRA